MDENAQAPQVEAEAPAQEQQTITAQDVGTISALDAPSPELAAADETVQDKLAAVETAIDAETTLAAKADAQVTAAPAVEPEATGDAAVPDAAPHPAHAVLDEIEQNLHVQMNVNWLRAKLAELRNWL